MCMYVFVRIQSYFIGITEFGTLCTKAKVYRLFVSTSESVSNITWTWPYDQGKTFVNLHKSNIHEKGKYFCSQFCWSFRFNDIVYKCWITIYKFAIKNCVFIRVDIHKLIFICTPAIFRMRWGDWLICNPKI